MTSKLKKKVKQTARKAKERQLRFTSTSASDLRLVLSMSVYFLSMYTMGGLFSFPNTAKCWVVSFAWPSPLPSVLHSVRDLKQLQVPPDWQCGTTSDPLLFFYIWENYFIPSFSRYTADREFRWVWKCCLVVATCCPHARGEMVNVFQVGAADLENSLKSWKKIVHTQHTSFRIICLQPGFLLLFGALTVFTVVECGINSAACVRFQ